MESTKDTPQDRPQDTVPDQLHQSLSSGWASFLAAQYCSREVDAIKKSLNEHIKQATIQHELLSVAVAQSRSDLDPPASLVTEADLKDHLESLRREMAENMSQISQKLTDHEERAENLPSFTSDDINAVQEKYLSALELVEYLQGELRDMRSDKVNTDSKLAELERQKIDTDIKLTTLERQKLDTDNKLTTLERQKIATDNKLAALEHQKIDTENKLAALERQISVLPQPPLPLSDEAVFFLNGLLARRDELIRASMIASADPATPVQQDQTIIANPSPEHVTRRTSRVGVGNTASSKGSQVAVPAKSKQSKNVSRQNQPKTAVTKKQPKRKAAEPPQTQPQPKRVTSKPRQPAKTTANTKPETVATDAQDTRDLYLSFRSRYDSNPPQNQVRGIWRFINQIKNPDLAKHLQESLAMSLPEYVRMGARGRLTTQNDGPQRIFVTISTHLTWKRFADAFDHYAALYLKE